MPALEDQLGYELLVESEKEAESEWERIGRFIRRIRPTLSRYGIIARIIGELVDPRHEPLLPLPPLVAFPEEKKAQAFIGALIPAVARLMLALRHSRLWDGEYHRRS